MSEKVVRRWVIEALRPLHAVPVENPAFPGTPDVAHALGFIELKHHAGFVRDNPKRVLKISTYTTQQRLWARQHYMAGGDCKMLLQVGRRTLLLEGITAAVLIGEATLERLYEEALVRWDGRPEPRAFLRAIIDHHQPWTPDLFRLRRESNYGFSVGGRTGA